jgi:protein O-mannosyl-transferase
LSTSLAPDPVSPAEASAPLGRRGAAACAAAACLGGLVYLNALHNPFVYDDQWVILDNSAIVQLWDVRRIVAGAATRPLVNLSYAIDRALWGVDPFGFHLTNVLLHMLNVALLFRVAWHVADDHRSITPSDFRPAAPIIVAFAGASLFAVHPLMTEAVGYISGRSEVLCATFFLAALLCARRWMRGGGKVWWLATAGMWLAALLAKEIAAMFPVVVLCYDRWLVGGDAMVRRRRLVRLHLPLAVTAIGAGTIRLAVFVAMEHPGDVSVHWLSILDEVDVMRRYVVLLLVPSGQAIFHEVVPLQRLLDPRALVGVGTVVAMVAIAWGLRRREGAVSAGLIWFLALLVPSSLLFVLNQGEAMAEHRVYLASCGLFLAAAMAIGRAVALTDHLRRPVRVLACAAFTMGLLSLSGRTFLRNTVWASPVSLWQEAADLAPESWLPRTVLGEALDAAGQREEAIAAFTTALRLRPEEEDGYMKLGTCLAELGRIEEANATFEALRRRKPQSPTVSTGLGAVSLISGQPEQAKRYFLETLEKDPRDVAALQWLAVLEEDANANPAEALRRCEQIEQLVPGRLGTADCIRRNRARLTTRAPGLP